MKAPRKMIIFLGAWLCSIAVSWATSNHEYGADEYDTVVRGLSPDGKYAIATHGSSDNYGYTGFQVCLINNVTGKKIGPLEEIDGNLDTGCDAFAAKWSADSTTVYVVYRIDRHEPLQSMTYKIAHGRAYPQSHWHVDASDEQIAYWGRYGSGITSSPKTFGTPKKTDDNQ